MRGGFRGGYKGQVKPLLRPRLYLGFFSSLLAASACVPKSPANASDAQEAAALAADPAAPPPTAKHVNRRSGPAAALERNLSAHFKKQFTLGVALEPHYLGDWAELLPSTFNRLTAENAMKCRQIHPTEQNYRFEPADQLADFARAHSMKMTGHALVWHRETPDWLIKGSHAEIKQRLKQHIDTVVARYADVTDNWDVVNEAVSDSPGKVYRDAEEGSAIHGAVGKAYISDAFELAAAAVQATGRNIDLYYNDYNMNQPEKRSKALQIATELRNEGKRIDGIGAQAHWNLSSPSALEIQNMIDDIVEAGFKVKISELDISAYPADDWTNKVWQAERPLDEELNQALARRYKEIFDVFTRNAEHITSVTLWGVSDDRTWLNSFPAGNRRNYPLLFDGLDRPKAAYFSLFDVATGD